MILQQIKAIIQLLRPLQWIKNAFVLAPLFFAYRFDEKESWTLALTAVLCFILASSVVYIINDIRDVAEDRTHPRKKLRPIASGRITVPVATALSCLLLGAAIALLFKLPLSCTIIISIYLLLQVAYTCSLKKQAIFDVLIIASGFVLRVLMGGYAINAPISPWIILTTYLLALFLGFGKRYHELSVDGYSKNRHSLRRYSKPLLDRLIGISCVSALLSYAMYAVETARLLDKTELVYTVVFVIFGLFRYLQVLYLDDKGGEPEKILLKDKIFFANGVLWFIVTMLILAN